MKGTHLYCSSLKRRPSGEKGLGGDEELPLPESDNNRRLTALR